MPEPEQHQIPFQGRRIKNPRLRRGIFLLPSLFTVANLLCGYYAVVASLLGGRDDFDHAAKVAVLLGRQADIRREAVVDASQGVQLWQRPPADNLAGRGGDEGD